MKPALFNVLCEIKEKTGEFCFFPCTFFCVLGFFLSRPWDGCLFFYGLSSQSITLCFFYFSQPLRKEGRFIGTKRRSAVIFHPPLFPFNDLWLPDGSLADKRHTPCMWTPLAPDEVLSLGWSVFMPTFGPFQGDWAFSHPSLSVFLGPKASCFKKRRGRSEGFFCLCLQQGGQSHEKECVNYHSALTAD